MSAYAGVGPIVRRQPTCGTSRRGLRLPLNRARVTGVLGSMRDLVVDRSRGFAAAGVLFAAVVDLDLWQPGFRDIHTIGTLFPLNAVGGLGIGVALALWRRWLPAVAAVGFGVRRCRRVLGGARPVSCQGNRYRYAGDPRRNRSVRRGFPRSGRCRIAVAGDA